MVFDEDICNQILGCIGVHTALPSWPPGFSGGVFNRKPYFLDLRTEPSLFMLLTLEQAVCFEEVACPRRPVQTAKENSECFLTEKLRLRALC